jgi:protocatechuate 3,4-dioxygenase beta subunit
MLFGKAFFLVLFAVCAGCTTAAPAGNASAGACQATPAETEGPYFKAGSPERASLVEPGMAGTRLTITGRVLTVDCRPVSGAVLDFWQADASGRYDNTGYRLRGHQATDSSGAYALQTVVPGEYPGRTQHIHVKVGASGRATLTTQLYFPGGTRNQGDSLFNQALLLHSSDSGGGKTATFDFVLNIR